MLYILTFTVQNIQHSDKSNKNLFSTERDISITCSCTAVFSI